MNKVIKNPTYFVDIDGTITKYRKFNEIEEITAEPIQDVIDYVNREFDNGAIIIITTARPNSYRLLTEHELDILGVKYHKILMGCGRGSRIILNDLDPDNPEIPRAVGINLKRDEGLKNIEIPNNIKSYESN
jgi:hypothetical protein